MDASQRKALESLQATYHKGDVVFEEGDDTRDFYILLAGEVEVRRGGQLIATLDCPDTYLGEMSTLLGTPRTATIVATQETRMVRVPEERVTEFFKHSPVLGLKLARVLAMRLDEMNRKYQAVLDSNAETASDEDLDVFSNLVRTRHRREFMDLYKRNVGRRVSLKTVRLELDADTQDILPIVVDYALAGLLGMVDRDIVFRETTDRQLKIQIATWKKK